MDKELAKELQTYGFNQRAEGEWNGEFDVRIPSLASLIEECGEGFLDLIRTESWEEVEWTASGRRNGGPAFQERRHSTPEEAVAKLWLALNKK